MPNYLVKANYSPAGVKGVLEHGGAARADAVRTAIEAVGGTMHSFEFAFGGVDVYVRAELPDNVSAAALSLTVSSSGLAACEVVVLLTPAEIDQAAGVVVPYTPPGG